VPTCGQVNSYLLSKRLWDLAYSPDLPANTRYYGMVDGGGGFMSGCAVSVPGFVASGPTGMPSAERFSWDTDGSYGDWYGAHELAHTWGREDVPFCGAEGGAYPYPDGRISPTLSGDSAIYGFDIFTRAIYEPAWKDVMGFCPYQWVSDFTYKGLLDFFKGGAGAGALQPPPRPLPSTSSGQALGKEGVGEGITDRLLVVGTIDPTNDSVELQPLVGRIEIPLAGHESRVAISPDGALAYVAVIGAPAICKGNTCSRAPATVAAIDTASRQVTASIPIDGWLTGIAFTPGGDFLYVSDAEHGIIAVIERATNTVSNRMTVPEAPGPIAMGMVQGDCQVSAAATPLPTRTTTPTPSNTPTRTLRPTRTPTVPSPTPTMAPHVQLEVGSVSGSAGGQVEFSVTLHAASFSVAGIQNDIQPDPPLVIAASEGRPDCRVNPAIAKTASGFACLASGYTPGVTCGRMRALIVDVSNLAPIRDGSLLYTCTAVIPPDAAPGTYRLAVSSVIASDPRGQRILAAGAEGAIVVSAPAAIAAQGPEQPAAAPGSSGCQAGQPDNSGVLFALLFPVVGLVLRRHASRTVIAGGGQKTNSAPDAMMRSERRSSLLSGRIALGRC
jgi:hypothetical protein